MKRFALIRIMISLSLTGCIICALSQKEDNDNTSSILKSASIDFLSQYLAADSGYDYYQQQQQSGVIKNMQEVLEDLEEEKTNAEVVQPEIVTAEMQPMELEPWVENNQEMAVIYAQAIQDNLTFIEFEILLADLASNPCNQTESRCLFFQQTVRYMWNEDEFGCFPSRECVFQGFSTQEECELECRG